MDILKNALASSSEQKEEQREESRGGGLMEKLNEMAGGGRKAEEKEDGLDKAIDFVQEKFLGQGAQDNESALEQAKDKQIAECEFQFFLSFLQV
ncbi:hypothetical protein EX30DRAFT_312620 [Ascodesmis nigricans]|uniref:Uncharacterized protein n=1 Tax=Ascodesmis nigricans TaxID=341454 RepID=A0A4S2MP78_9PEZI|nr:hypothetical protein EX30DRAFT_312620 [Ascodesmis nigricans]